ncbi:MAG: tetratricopeptide repeat protein [Leptolyngbya sp. PLA3]|nr:MAG: tetratricopeptide repeat protein [Cyanobacteria bacterium CYA]MCE7969400.1 tetratricopeptide repeat protein [Leptolyngbya sp. PL-A3]
MAGGWQKGVVTVIGSLALLGGCSKYSRSLDMVRADGNEAYAAGKYTLALADYQEYMERKPGSTDVRYRLGETLMQLHRPTEAESHFRAVYDVNPSDVRGAKGLASAMIAGGRGGDGLDFFRAYLDQRPTGEGYFAMGDLAMQAGVPDDAERALLIAAKLDGKTSPEPHRHLGRFYEQMQKDELAILRWRAVLFFDVMDTEARDHLRALGQVPGPSAVIDPSTLD